VKTTEEQKLGARSLAHSTLGVEGHARASGWGLGRDMHSHGPAQTKQQVG
jgi:hypothetical protein